MRKLYLLLILSLLVFSCSDDDNIMQKDTENSKSYTLAQMKEMGTEMFTDADNENDETGKPIIYNREKRAVHVNQMLEVKMINGKVRIRNFLPYEFSNVYLVAENTSAGTIRFAEFVGIPKLSWTELELTFNVSNGKIKLLNEQGEPLTLPASFANEDKASWNFKIVGDDSMLEKLAQITIPTEYFFAHLNFPGKTGPVYAKDAKKYLPILANMAYVWSSPEFERAIVKTNYDFVNAGNFVDKEELVEQCRSLESLALGIVIKKKLGGYGEYDKLLGNSTVSLNPEYINNSLDIDYFYDVAKVDPTQRRIRGLGTWIHESAHALGYVHEGNMTYLYAGKGFVLVVAKVYQDLLSKGKLPFTAYPYSKTSDK